MCWCIPTHEQKSRCNGRRTEPRCCQSWTPEPSASGLPSPDGKKHPRKNQTDSQTCHTHTHKRYYYKILKFPDLEDVFSRGDVSDVDPLTVDVGVVGVIATRTQPLWADTLVNRGPGWIIHPINGAGFGHLGVWRAGVSAVVSRVTGSVLQTETGLVALGDLLLGVGVQQLVQAELVHAVEVAEK